MLAFEHVRMNISTATQDDLDAVMSLVTACVRHMDSQGIAQWNDVYPSRTLFAKDIASQSLFVATVDAQARGVIALNEHQEPEYREISWAYDEERILVVHRLCVHPDSQGQGVAARLMDFVEHHAEVQGYSAIRLDAFTENPAAVSLYYSRGYRRAGTVRFRKGTFYCFEKKVNKPEGSNNVLDPVGESAPCAFPTNGQN